MKFTLSWLREHLDTDANLTAIAERLTAIGLEVEGIEDKARTLAPFTVAHVVSAEPHPNADKLRVCMVDTGREVLQVVCGAPNARAGMKGVFAPAGTTIPGTGLALKPTTIRGVASNGMLCSEREMGLSQEHDGIIELPADAPVGAPFAEILGLGDPVIEINLTPNRGDCAGVFGIARDLAASGLGLLKAGHVTPVAGRFASPIQTRLDFTPGTQPACTMFAGRLIRGLTNRPSPDWLQRRLKAVGLRPISALVDVTNLLSLDRARPLHVFDADKITGPLSARMARAGETLLGLDGRTYTLTPEICVIADAVAARGIGGVMGGEETGCTMETRAVFIEAALFDPAAIATAGRITGIISDARYRFERGVDPAFCLPGLELATRLILDICGGEPSDVVVAGTGPEWQRRITFAPGRVAELTGLHLPDSEIIRILTDLGFTVAEGQTLQVTPPSWRPDVHGPADLVEEVVRIAGLGRVPATPLPRPAGVTRPVLTQGQRRARDARRLLAARGLTEAVTYSFVSRAHAALFGGGQEELRLANPISADLDVMRASVLPSLAAAAQRNAARSIGDVHLFEIGPQFGGGRPGEQQLVAAGLRMGAGPRTWTGRTLGADVFAAKADALALLAMLGAPAGGLQVTADAPAWYHPGRSGVLRMGPKNTLAFFGELHPSVLAAFDLTGPVAAFEVVLDALPPAKARATKARPAFSASEYPPVTRDFAFIVGAHVRAADIARAAGGVDRSLIEDVGVFDVYTGKGVPEGQVSIAISVRLQPSDRTLTEAEIEAVGERIVAAVVKASGGHLRT